MEKMISRFTRKNAIEYPLFLCKNTLIEFTLSATYALLYYSRKNLSQKISQTAVSAGKYLERV